MAAPSGRPQAIDAALVAWAQAAVPDDSALAGSADGEALLLLARHFVPDAAAAVAARGQELTELAEVGEILRVARSPKSGGSPEPHARALLPVLLVAAVEGPQREHAIGCIVGLEPSHQAALAGLLQQQMDSAGARATPPSVEVVETVRRLSIRRESAVLPRRTFFTGAAEAEADDEAEEQEMRSEVQEFRSELEDRQRRCDVLIEAHRHEAQALREAKERLCQEADLCHDRDKDLEDYRDEAQSLDHRIKLLGMEIEQEAGCVELDEQRTSPLHRRIEEERSECRALRKGNLELESQLDAAASNLRQHRLSWRQAALRARFSRLSEEVQSRTRHLRHARAMEDTEAACEATLTDELHQAEMRLAERDGELSSIVARVRETEEGLHHAQSKLEICQQELRISKISNMDDLRTELWNCRILEGQASARSEEARTKLHELEEGYGPVWQLSQALKDRAAPDPTTTRLVRLRSALAKSEAEVKVLRPKIGASLSTAEVAEGKAKGRLLEARKALATAEEKAGSMEREAAEAAKTAESYRQRALAQAEGALKGRPPEAPTPGDGMECEASKGGEACRAGTPPEVRGAVRALTPVDAAAEGSSRELVDARTHAVSTLMDMQAPRMPPAEGPTPPPGEGRAAQGLSGQDPDGISAEVLEEQIALREREVRHREVLASEAESRHGREMRLLASSLHRLGLRYGRLLGQCEALEAERS